MATSGTRVHWVWFFLFALCFCAQVIPNILNDSPYVDETVDLASGYFYWQGDVLVDGGHPPFLKFLQALPLQIMSPRVTPGLKDEDMQLRGYQFLFELNRDRFEQMLFPGRFLTLLFGLGIGLLLFWLARPGPPIRVVSALALWAFEPTLLGFSAHLGSDVPEAFFLLLITLCFWKPCVQPGVLGSVLAGFLLGLGVCTKFSVLFLLPALGILELAAWHSLGPNERKNQIFPRLQHGCLVFLSLAATIGLIYLPATLTMKMHPDPFSLFFENFKSVAGYYTEHHPVYFLGKAGLKSHWYYFPAAFFLKSTLPMFLLTLFALAAGITRKISFPDWMWIPPLVFGLQTLTVINFGVRYLLPLYPFLFLMIAEGCRRLWVWRPSTGARTGSLLVAGFLIWHAASTLASAPHMISYFNDLVSWPQKVYLLGDSNLDIGQDLKRLAETARQRGWGRVKLAQFGGAIDPSVYGMKWDYWTQKDLEGPQPGEVYAVNAFLLQLGPAFLPSFGPIAKSWVSSTPPTGRVGDTWIYFEIPGKPVPDHSPLMESVSVF